MRFFQIELGYIYEYGDDQEAKEAKRIQERLTLLTQLGIKHTFDDADIKNGCTIMVNSDQMADMMKRGEKFTVKAEQDAGAGAFDAATKFIALAKKFEASLKTMGDDAFNQKVNVHVPGAALMMVNRTMLLEDACTDALQSKLDQGWRILSVCPQPDTRRPDYVLGRYDQGYTPDVRSSAERG